MRFCVTQQIQFLSSVEQIMDTDVHWILDDEPISYVRSLFDEGDGRPVAVVDHEHRLIGTLTETDDLADERMTAGQVASRARRVASPGDSAFDVASSMLEKNVDWIPVVSDGKLVGSLSRDCVLAAFGEMRAI